MKAYVIEYDFNVVTVNMEAKSPEHRVECFTQPQEFLARAQYIANATSVYHEAAGVKMHTNIKTYGGELKEIPLSKVLNPFGESTNTGATTTADDDE